ncbi:hypothetical protein BLGI_2750 [Brevibacillus laterosporus GI-9]|nr:hypothetical protein BLGI_2750 [Brevibacillus laterosporus GI-9]
MMVLNSIDKQMKSLCGHAGAFCDYSWRSRLMIGEEMAS